MKPVPTNTVPFFWHIPAQKPKKVKPSNNKNFINQYQKTPFKVGFADAGL